MNGRVFSFGKSGNPLAQILSLLVFAVMLTAALIMGAVVIAVLIGLAVIFGAVLFVRAWWFRRKLRNRPFDRGYEPTESAEQGAEQKPGPTRLIEGEYEVVKQRDQDDTRRQR